MGAKRNIPVWIRKNPLILTLSVLALTLNAGAALGKIAALRSLVDAFVRSGTMVDAVTKSVSTTGWFFFCLSSGFTISIILAVLYIQAQIRLQIVTRQKQERARTAYKTLEGMMLAAYRIREQLIPAARQPIKVIKSIKNTYLIHKNLDTEVRREYHVSASDVPLHFWEIKIGVESAADPAEYLDDIDFKVCDESGRDIKYLPTRNDPRKKKVVPYFLPQIECSEEKPRIIVLTYRWPGMLKQLNEIGNETFTWVIESKDPVQQAEFSFYLEPGAGGNLACEVLGPQSGNQTLVECSHAERKWPGWEYKIQNAPNDEYAIALRLKKP